MMLLRLLPLCALMSTAMCATHRDITFATVDELDLKLDLSIPEDVSNPVLVVWIHGGGWRSGSYKNNRVDWLVDHGIAVASISYRKTQVAIYPAQIHDCKAAIRWLRAHATRYGYRSDRIIAAGGSAGGHLAALLGTSNGVAELEGTIGDQQESSSQVQAVISYFGLSDFPLRHSTNGERHLSPTSGAYTLLGGTEEHGMDPELERHASPVTWVSAKSAPMLWFHGTADTTVTVDQAHRMAAVYAEHRLPCTVSLLEGGSHSDKRLFIDPYRQQALDFIATVAATP